MKFAVHRRRKLVPRQQVALVVGTSWQVFQSSFSSSWHTDEPLVVLPVLPIVSFFGGLINPSKFVLAALCLGWSILIAHALSTATGVLIPRYRKQAPSTGDWTMMALLVIPSALAAFAGARAALDVTDGE